jgi:hypothetical protein
MVTDARRIDGLAFRASPMTMVDTHTTGSPRIEHKTIPRGLAGTMATVAHVAELIAGGAKDFEVRQHAIAILRQRQVRAKDYAGEIRALFDWVQGHIRYTRDPSRVEVLHSARRMLQLRAGDCDDMSIVLGALLESIGHPVRLVLTGSDPREPTRYTHIYIEACCRGRWVPLDATMAHPAGWAPATPVKRVVSLHDARGPLDGDDPNPPVRGVARHDDVAAIEAGIGLYQAFNRFGPARVARRRHSRVMPRVVVELGDLVGLMYRSDKWQRGHPRTFIHVMRRRPRLVCDPAGRQLYIVGGAYRVTRRGIEG